MCARIHYFISELCAILSHMEPKIDSPHASIEAEIQKFSETLGSHEHIDRRAGEHKEALKESLRERVYTHAPAHEKSSVSIPVSPQSGTVLPSYLDDAATDIKLKVEQMVDLAYHKGIMEAIKEAKKGGPLILDAFHDALTDRVYEDLKRRGILR